jgi:hypothetical protein
VPSGCFKYGQVTKGFYFSSGFQFRDFFFNLGNCRENLCKFFFLRTSPKGSENVISRPLWACPEGRNVAQNFPVPKLKPRLSLTGFLKRHDPTKSRSRPKGTGETEVFSGKTRRSNWENILLCFRYDGDINLLSFFNRDYCFDSTLVIKTQACKHKRNVKDISLTVDRFTLPF